MNDGYSLLPGSERSPLRHWDARWRLLCLLLLAFAISQVTRVALLPWVALLTLAILLWSRIPLSAILQRLRYPSLMILAIVALLPFSVPGDELWRFSAIAITQQGVNAALLVLLRFLAILSLALLFFGVAPLVEHIRAARALGLPDLIADLALLTVRYLEILRRDLQRMRSASHLRGDSGRSWRSLFHLIGLTASLLLRSHERSARVYQAMRLRGYGLAQPPARLLPPPRSGPRDWGITAWMVTSAATLVLLELVW